MSDKLECKNCNWLMRADTERYHIQSDKEFKAKKTCSTKLWKCSNCKVVAIGNKVIDWYEEFDLNLSSELFEEPPEELDDLL